MITEYFLSYKKLFLVSTHIEYIKSVSKHLMSFHLFSESILWKQREKEISKTRRTCCFLKLYNYEFFLKSLGFIQVFFFF